MADNLFITPDPANPRVSLQKQQAHGFKVGQRVRVTFACPTAAKDHEAAVGKIGTVTEIKTDAPSYLLHTNDYWYPCPWGCIKVRFDTPIIESTRIAHQEWFLSYELSNLEGGE